MTKNWWFKFDFKDWRTDSDLRRCSLETKGFWLELLCIMHETGESVVTGSYEELGRLVGCDTNTAAGCVIELQRTKTADVRFCKDDVSIESRRITRELKAKRDNRLYVARHREKVECKDDVRTHSKSKSNKKEIREEEETPQAATPPPAKAMNRGSRIPDSFLLTSEMRDYGGRKRPDIDIDLETERFVNYWRAASGRTAAKLDWVAAWRTWILGAYQNGSNKKYNAGAKPTNLERLDSYNDILDQYPSETELGHIA